MYNIVFETVTPEQLASPDFEVRLRAEKILSYNAGILHALEIVHAQEQDQRGQDNLPQTAVDDTQD